MGARGWRITTIKELLLLDYHDSFNSFIFYLFIYLFIYSEFGLK